MSNYLDCILKVNHTYILLSTISGCILFGTIKLNALVDKIELYR